MSKPISFQNCTELTDVVANGVTTLGNNEFNGCSKLSNFQGRAVSSIGNSAFKGCEKMGTCILSSTIETFTTFLVAA